jgi:hypothetical protein
MAADTVTLPETITITSTQALDIIGLLSAYAAVCADFTADAEADPFYGVNNDAFVALHDQLKRDETDEYNSEDVTSAIFDRSLDREHVYAEQIRLLMDHNPAFSIAKLRHDVNKLEMVVGV